MRADLIIEFMGGDPDIDQSFQAWLADAGLGATRGDSGWVVRVRGWTDCERWGEQLSRFVAGRSESFKLRVDGPGGESLLHEVRMVADADSMTRFLATSAYLQ
ncbi:hypothetical protein [Micromonospora endolithica]|uniref:Uncharacterized protein n=1 Tax=Micromonospora endolithica TaxID=230091 RepID=A0A3A9ZNH8_9ACTN|nr:hypothetical protein [Micromonospora endolithica]RKN49464.1 hypothetical protein D7223_08235 [Micromonospora endolithica]TWJ23668.1 hypothetical protein JD76_03807 [Micromonospora endolithica]